MPGSVQASGLWARHMDSTVRPLSEPVEPVPSTLSVEPLRRRLFVGSAYAFLATILGQGLGLVTSIIYARLLGTYDLGVLAIYAQVTSLAVALAALGLATPTTKFVAQLRTENRVRLEEMMATIMTLALGSAVAASVGFFLFALLGGFAVYGSADLVLMISLASVFLTLNALTGIGAAILQGLQRIRFLSLAGIATEGLAVPVMLVCLSLTGLVGAAIGGILLVVFSTSVTFGTAWKALHNEGIRLRISVSRGVVKELATFALPLLGSAIIVKVALLLQSTLIALGLGYGDTGLFRVASTVARVVAFVAAAVSVPLLPAVTELYSIATPERARENLTAILRITVYVGFPFAVLVGLLVYPAILILYGRGYTGATSLAFVLVATGFVDLIGSVAANAMLGDGRTRALLALDIVQSVLLVGLTIAFIAWFGLIGVGYAALVTAIVYSIVILTELGRRGRVDIRNLAPPVVFASCGFGLITVVVVSVNVLRNYAIGGVLIIGSFVLTWVALSRAERRLLAGLARDTFRLRGGPK